MEASEKPDYFDNLSGKRNKEEYGCLVSTHLSDLKENCDKSRIIDTLIEDLLNKYSDNDKDNDNVTGLRVA